MSRHRQLISPSGSHHSPAAHLSAWPCSRRRQPRSSHPSPHPGPTAAPPSPPSPKTAPAPPQTAPRPPAPHNFQFAFAFPGAPSPPLPESAADAMRNLRQGLECGVATASEALRSQAPAPAGPAPAGPAPVAPAPFPILDDSARRRAIHALGQEIAASPNSSWKGLLLLRSALQLWRPQPACSPSPSTTPPTRPGLLAAAKVYTDWIDRGLLDPSTALRLTLEKAVLDVCATPWPRPINPALPATS